MPARTPNWRDIVSDYHTLDQMAKKEVVMPNPTTDHNGQNEVIALRIQELEQQARSYLSSVTKTTDSYKQARECYATILGYQQLSKEQRTEYEQRQKKVEQDYEAFRAKHGELTTARQTGKVEEQLIAIRKLINQDVTADEQGKDLASQLPDLLVKERGLLIRSAEGRVSSADNRTQEGVEMLDPGQMQQAIACFDDAIGIVQGQKIGQELLSSITDDKEKETTKIAIEGIRNIIQDDTITTKVSDWTQRKENVEKLKTQIERVLTIYNTANTLFEEENYYKAHQALAGIPGIIEHFHSRTVSHLETRIQEAYERDLNVDIEKLYNGAVSDKERGAYEAAKEKIEKILDYEKKIWFDSETFPTHKTNATALQAEMGREERETHKENVQELLTLAQNEQRNEHYLQALRALCDVQKLDPQHKMLPQMKQGLRIPLGGLCETLLKDAHATTNVTVVRTKIQEITEIRRWSTTLYTDIDFLPATSLPPLDRLDKLHKTVETQVPRDLEAANKTMTKANEAEENKHISQAITHFKNAQEAYTNLEQLLTETIEALAPFRDYAVVTHLYLSAQEHKDTVTDLCTSSVTGHTRCTTTQQTANAKLREAREAFDTRDYRDAITFAGEARNGNVDLKNETDEIIRRAEIRRDEERPSAVPQQLVIGGIVVGILLVLIVFGPPLLQWITAFPTT